MTQPRRYSGIIDRYRNVLPVSDATSIVSLGEGDTPLIRSSLLSRRTGADVWLKCEGLNPTGSFKDRGMTLAISKALEEGSEAVVCASTGNTSASAAAYAARAGMTCGVLVPRGYVARGKLAQALLHGARVLEIDDNFDRALELVSELAEEHPVTLVNSVNPYRIEGQKTAAFEIIETMGDAPDLHFMPVGNAGNITAYWRGYREARTRGWAASLPGMLGWQADGANPIVRGEPVPSPDTIATAIRIGRPASWQSALDAAQESGGSIASVPDEEIVAAHALLAREGVFVEYASAAGVAGLLRTPRAETEGRRIAIVLTGHGLKDPDSATASGASPVAVDPEAKSILAAMNLV